MKYFKLITGLMVFMTILCQGKENQKMTQNKPMKFLPMRVCSCNLRGAIVNPANKNDIWEVRRSSCLEVLLKQKADIYCFQEMQIPNREAIEKAFPDYRFFGALDRPQNGHPMNGILYKKNRFKEIGLGTYALSDHPHIIGSMDWKNNYPRFVNYLILQDIASGKMFRIVNTHLDHESQIAREKSVDLINEESAAYSNDLPQILTGDMNSSIDNPALQKLLENGWRDTFREATGIVEPGFTFHKFMGQEYTGPWQRKIDFIFARGNWKIKGTKIVKDKGRSGYYPSDHYFVWTDFDLK